MSSLMVFIAPLALAAAAPPAAAEASEPQGEWALGDPAPPESIALAPDSRGLWRWIVDAFRAEPAEHVRIEQRMIIRITPLGPQREMLADLPRAPLASRFSERKVGKCVPMSGIAGVQIGGDDRLLLFMRDQRILSATLEKGCSARDYYSGFLVERTSDGMLCAGRDKLLARSGANCGMGKLSQIVVVGDDDE